MQVTFIDGAGDLSLPLKIRLAVFCQEQGFSEEIERDDKDDISTHVLLCEDDNTPIATSRFYSEQHGVWHIGRVATLKTHRGRGIGDALMWVSLTKMLEMGAQSVVLTAQLYVVPFYERFGFVSEGGHIFEEGVAHQPMRASAQTILKAKAART